MRPELHAVPLNDAIEHEAKRTCVCGPLLISGPNRLLYKHHALVREAVEREEQ